MSCKEILLVEDEPDLRETLTELLEMCGFRVRAAANGKEALQILAEPAQPCLILLDLMMPVMNGWQFLQAVTEMRAQFLKEVPVVVLSAAADLSSVHQQYGIPTLKKPVGIDTILQIANMHCVDGG